MNRNEILKIVKADLRSSELKRTEQDSKIKQWKAEYDGDPYGNEQNGKSRIVSRDIKRQSEWQHASIVDPFVSTPDIVKCFPITWEDVDAARQNEVVLNTQFTRQFPRYNFMTKAVKVLDREGTLVVQTGWEYEDEEVEVEVPKIDIGPDGLEFINGTETITETRVLKNRPTAVVCRNEDIFIDPTCMDNMDKCQFVIHRFETDLSTLKKDGRYKNLDKIMPDTHSYDANGDFENNDDTGFQFTDNPRKKIIVYEYWGNIDVNHDGIAEPIVCSFVGNTIIRLQTNPYPDSKPPFIVVPFNSMPFELYGEPNAALISDNQKVKTAVIRGIIDNMAQSNNGVKGIRKGVLDATNKQRFLSNQNFEFNTADIGNAIYSGKFNELPSSAFNVLTLMDNQIESITGTKSFSGGITGDALGQTATGARGALDSTATRRLNVIRNISENLIKPLLRKWIAYNSEFLDEEEIVRITNENFVSIKRDDLYGNIDIDIQVSTSEDNSAKAQELAFMIQTIGPSMDPSITRMLMADIARLQKLPDVAKRIEEYQEPGPTPEQQRMVQLEIAMREAQLRNELAKAGENEVDIQLKSAKTRNEIAKARNLDSKSDIEDLKFIAEDSGLNYAREIEKDALKSQMSLNEKLETSAFEKLYPTREPGRRSQ